jgi:hypothetical protein
VVGKGRLGRAEGRRADLIQDGVEAVLPPPPQVREDLPRVAALVAAAGDVVEPPPDPRLAGEQFPNPSGGGVGGALLRAEDGGAHGEPGLRRNVSGWE